MPPKIKSVIRKNKPAVSGAIRRYKPVAKKLKPFASSAVSAVTPTSVKLLMPMAVSVAKSQLPRYKKALKKVV